MRLMLYRKLVLFAMMFVLASCQTLSSVTKPKTDPHDAPFCLMAKPIHAKKTDDAVTREEVSEHNNIGIQLCGWKP